MVRTRVMTRAIHTPVGEMIAGADEKGISFLQFYNEDILDSFISHHTACQELPKLMRNPSCDKILDQLEREMSSYFAGRLRRFRVPVQLHCTHFQAQCWQAINEIPYGKTLSFQKLARDLRMPQRVRMIIETTKQNRHLLLVPCHRLVSEDGKLVSYNGSLSNKEHLQKLESHIGL